MALAEWPSTLPDPDASDFGHQPQDVLERSAMRIGTPRVRLKQTHPIVNVPQSWTMNMAQYNEFQEWHAYVLKHGQAPFYGRIFRAGSYEEHECRFVGPYRSSYIGPEDMSLRATLEVLDIFVPQPTAGNARMNGAAFVTYADLGTNMRVTLHDNPAPNPHTPTRVELRFSQPFVSASAVTLRVGYSTTPTTPSELVFLADIRDILEGVKLSIVNGHGADGPELGFAEAAQRTYVAQLSGSGLTAGRLHVALYWSE